MGAGAEPLAGWRSGLLAFAVLLAGQLGLGAVLVLLARALPGFDSRALFEAPAIVAQVLATTLLLVGISLLFTRGPGRARELACGGAPWRIVVLAALGGIAAGVLVDELAFLLNRGAPDLFSADGLDLIGDACASASPLWFVALGTVLAAGPGFAEELFFRGLLQRRLARGWPPVAAVGAAAVAFGLLHLDPLQGTAAAAMGLYLGAVAWWSGSIVPAVATHAVNNLVVCLGSRLFADDAQSVVREGHEPWLLALAAAIVAAALYGLWCASRGRDAQEGA